MRSLVVLAMLSMACDPSLADPWRCLNDAHVKTVVDGLRRAAAPESRAEDMRLVSSSCEKRVYVVGDARLVVWKSPDGVRGKSGSTRASLPSEDCIERGLARTRALVPFGGAILDRAAKRDPLWRDPDVGVVSYLQCEAETASPRSIATMLHEANHNLGAAACSFAFDRGQDICFDLPRGLPAGTIAAYTAPPKGLDRMGLQVYEALQSLYLERNRQGLRELLDEVMAYRIDAELRGVPGFTRKGYIEVTNLPMMMTLVVRYLDAFATRDPKLARRVVGPGTDNRTKILALLESAEASYRKVEAARSVRAFEKTFWGEYQRTKARWLAR